MEVCHTNSFLDSPAAQRLAEFVQKRGEQWAAQDEMSTNAPHLSALSKSCIRWSWR